jgi:hypothetical protein
VRLDLHATRLQTDEGKGHCAREHTATVRLEV